MKKNAEFSDRLRILIEKRLSIKHKEFAKTVGISPGYLSQVLSGKGPSAALISGVYLYYSEHICWLLTGKDPSDDARIAEVARQLSEIGMIDREMFGRVVGYTQATLDAARSVKKSPPSQQ